MLVPRHQCDQDAHAVARGTCTIPQFPALRISHLYRGGRATFLDGHNASTGTTSGAFPFPILFSLPVLLYASLSGCFLDEWGHCLHDLRESHRAHWWARVIDTGNEYRHMFLYTPSFIKRPIDTPPIMFPGMADSPQWQPFEAPGFTSLAKG